MDDDWSSGWEAHANNFSRTRSDAGTDAVTRWSEHLEPASIVLDIGCGTGVPVCTTLVNRGFEVCGIDPSPTLLAIFRRHFPSAETACEPAQTSCFFGRRFEGIVAIGVMFLLSEDSQTTVIEKVGRALRPGGQFLFSAPHQICRWNDILTGRPSLSLGEKRYRQLLANAGCRVVDNYSDEGSNFYYHAVSDRL